MTKATIKDFYLGISIDGSPTYDEVLVADDAWLEARHDWCQRAYPNFEESQIVPGSPVLDEATLNFLKQTCQHKALMLVFKLHVHYINLVSYQIPHNNRRVTRMIKFLKLMGQDMVAESASAMFTDALDIATSWGSDISDLEIRKTKDFWQAALDYKKGDEWTVTN